MAIWHFLTREATTLFSWTRLQVKLPKYSKYSSNLGLKNTFWKIQLKDNYVAELLVNKTLRFLMFWCHIPVFVLYIIGCHYCRILLSASGVCQCESGWIGDDCSVDTSQPPEVFGLPKRGLCDIRYRPCDRTVVYGKRFARSESLKCKFEEVYVSEDVEALWKRQ